MKILKKNGNKVEFNPNKILNRVKRASKGLNIDYTKIVIEAQNYIYDGITTEQIDIQLSTIASSYIGEHPDYSKLASILIMSRLHKELNVGEVGSWYNRLESKLDDRIKMKISWVKEIDYNRDFQLDYMATSTFFTNIAIKDNQKVIETPIEAVIRKNLLIAQDEIYFDYLMTRNLGYASPILTNAGTQSHTYISCSVNEVPEDSKDGIMDSLYETATQSSHGSGIGKWIGRLRSAETPYRDGRGKASGLVKYCKLENEFTRYFKQHEKRRGKAAVYLNIWHKDVLDVINIKNPMGSEEETCRDLMLALNLNDEFYKRFIKGEDWSLFCPHEVNQKMGFDLWDFFGEEFSTKYQECEANQDLSRNTINSVKLMTTIVDMQKSGNPYILNICNVNKANAQSSFGVIKTSQLCIEITNYTDSNTSAQCDLGAMSLPEYIINGEVDYNLLIQDASLLSYNLNRIIDLHKWSTDRAKEGGLSQRSIAIGMTGLADLFFLLKLPFTSEKAREINKRVQEAIYYGAIKGSIEYNKINKPELDSRLLNTDLNKKGIFQFQYYDNVKTTLDWEKLRKSVLKYGVCNSNFVANMPTATTASLRGYYECFDPAQDLVMVRQTIAGDILVFNKYLVKELEEMGVWLDVKNEIKSKGSIQDMNFPQEFKDRYRTIWEIKQKDLLEMAADRQKFVDHSQSMNLYWKEGAMTTKNLSNALVHGWKLGLKTGVYYTKAQKKSKAQDLNNRSLTEKPKDSPFECFGCSA